MDPWNAMNPIDATIERPAVEKPQDDFAQKTLILEELDHVLKSRFFRNSERGKQFLTYVVQNALAGRTDVLKERVIGIEVFGRPANYATGEDPVVRVQAGEVRRRLEQYYHSGQESSRVQIELPTGSYTPGFRWSEAVSEEPAAAVPALLEPELKSKPESGFRQALPWGLAAAGFTIALALAVHILWPGLLHRKAALERFWEPGFSAAQPILICVPAPIVYMPTHDFFDRYSSAHQGQFATEMQRITEALPLDSDAKLAWKDLRAVKDLGLATGDVYAAVQLTTFLDKHERRSQLRVGQNYSFADLRNSPAVLVGAYNNKWAVQLTSNLRYRFLDGNPKSVEIFDSAPGGQHWNPSFDEQGQVVHDFGLVTRLLDSKTGQFTVTIGGIKADGTQAAAELITNPDYFKQVLPDAPPNWETKNMEVVIETTVTDMIASPPHVVKAYFW